MNSLFAYVLPHISQMIYQKYFTIPVFGENDLSEFIRQIGFYKVGEELGMYRSLYYNYKHPIPFRDAPSTEIAALTKR